MRAQFLRLTIGLAVSAVALYIAFAGVDWPGVKVALQEANFGLLACVVPLLILLIVMRAQRWRLLFLPDTKVRLSATFVALNIGYMVNNVLPFQLGEIARAYTLGESEGVSKMRALSTILVERIFDTLALLLLLGLLLPFIDLPRVAAVSAVVILTIAAGAAAAVAFAAINRGRAESWLLRLVEILPKSTRPKIRQWVGSLLDGLSALRSPNIMAQIVGWTALSWTTSAGILYLILRALSIDAQAAAAPFLLVATTFGFFVPSSPASIGVYDAISVRTLTEVFSVSQEEATSFALAAHALYLVPATVLGAMFFLLHHLSIRRMQAWGSERTVVAPATPAAPPTPQPSPEAGTQI